MDNMPHIGKEIRMLSNRIKRALDESGCGPQAEDLTAIQGYILGFLQHNRDRDIYQRDVEREFRIRRSTATGILQNMEKNGYIIRASVEHDGRLKKLCLTEKAERRHDEIHRNIENIERRLRIGLSREEVESFLDIVGRMAENLEKSADRTSGSDE